MGLELEQTRQKIANGIPVSAAENVAFLRNSVPAMIAFMIENNAGNVNQTLRRLGYNHLGYMPNPVALVRQMQIFLDKNDVESVREVMKNFNVNRSLLTPEFLKEFDKSFLTT
jgi:hypothetical protein